MNNNQGQNMMEYAVLFCVVLSSLLIMQAYVQRCYQGRLKQEADTVGPQYSPKHTTSLIETNTTTNSVTYTGGETKAADLEGLVPDGVPIPEGMSVTFSDSGSSTSRKEAVDSFAAEGAGGGGGGGGGGKPPPPTGPAFP